MLEALECLLAILRARDETLATLATSRVTILLLIATEVTSLLARSTVMSMSVTTRPKENALVTGFPSMVQTYG